MKTTEIHDLSDDRIRQLLTLEFSKITDANIIKNYHPSHSDEPANIFYILDNTERYKRGCYYIVEDEGGFVCSAGWNQYDLDSTVALALTRAYVAPKHRSTFPMAENILPKILDSAVSYDKLWITVNEYNKTIYTWFDLAQQNKAKSLSKSWPSIYYKFKPVGKKNIYYTEQYVLERIT